MSSEKGITLKSEKKLQNELYRSLKPAVPEPYCFGKEIRVPYKHIYLSPANQNQKPKLEIWCFKQDLAIYRPLFTEEPSLIGMELALREDYKKVGIPFVILELKDKQPETDVILAYSRKAEMIKSIFPYCRYMLLINGKIDARTYRLGTVFDKILKLPDKNLEAEIMWQLGEAEKQLCRLGVR
jgi:hypothetical protein